MGADTTRPGHGTLLTPVSIERPSPGIASGADALPASDVTILRLFEEAGQELPAKALQRLANGITEASATILSSGSRADAGAQALVLTAGSASLPSMTGNTLSSAMPATLSHVDVPLNQPVSWPGGICPHRPRLFEVTTADLGSKLAQQIHRRKWGSRPRSQACKDRWRRQAHLQMLVCWKSI